MKPILKVKNLSKSYRLGEQKSYPTLRDSLASLFSQTKQSKKHFWALKNVSFQVNPGEVVGLVGKNGAGKSTLLKILSRITPPTQGEAILRGRLGSLLEVGTGLHMELTGRENIFLYGSIIGMSKQEIKSKFDQIVEFAGVEKFLDTPLKHFSSGMHLRLGFSVAAHLDTEILLVDEVLAVGDISFQEKCLSRISELCHQGKSVILVSHNMQTIRDIADRAILLDQGKLIMDDKSDQVVKTYINQVQVTSQQQHPDLKIKKVTLHDKNNKEKYEFSTFDNIGLKINYQAKKKITNPHVFATIAHQQGNLFSASTVLDGKNNFSLQGKGSISCNFKKVPLLPGTYSIHLAIIDENLKEYYFSEHHFLHFSIEHIPKNKTLSSQKAVNWLNFSDSSPLYIPYSWQQK